jgi:hypothetical protein
MTWGKVDDNLAFHPKVMVAGNEAMGLWVRSLSYCCQQLTDGFVSDAIVLALGGAGVADVLVSAGLWHEVEGGFQFNDWSHYQPSGRDERERRTRISALRSEAGKKGMESRWDNKPNNKLITNGQQKAYQNDNPEPEPEPEEKTIPANDVRDDVKSLCDSLVAGMTANGVRKPSVTDAWLKDARLLLDKDEIPLGEALRVLRWSQQDSFWKTNILSIPTFRKQFDRLRLASERDVRPPEEAKRERELEESRKRRQRELEHGEKMRREMAELAEQAVPAPRCRHDKILVVCDVCVRELANEVQ